MNEPEEDTPQGCGCAAAMVVLIVVAVPLALLWLASRDLFITAVVLIAWGAVLWAARSPVVLDDRNYVRDAPDPAPPTPSERGSQKEPQVSMMRDQNHPNRWVVTRPSRWLTEIHDKEG